jgi:hypothetical protein
MENINMKKNKIILTVALVLSLSANADNDEMRFKAGKPTTPDNPLLVLKSLLISKPALLLLNQSE